MGSMYAARLRNARRLGWKLKRALADGCLVLDEDGQRVQNVVFRGFYGCAGLQVDDVVYMHSDPEMANGMELSQRAFNSLFSGWKVIPPAQHVSLLAYTPHSSAKSAALAKQTGE